MTVNLQNRTSYTPVDRPRSTRVLDIFVGSSVPAGKFVPVEAIQLLREDSLRATVHVEASMGETFELLANKPVLRLTAVCVPKLAEPEWDGNRGLLEKAFAGKPFIEGQPVVPYFKKGVLGAVSLNAMSRYLGLHYKPTDEVNLQYHVATNLAWNWFARNRSSKLVVRELNDYSLPPAFWGDSQFSTIVPDVDTGLIMGEVPLTVIEGKLPVKGFGKISSTFPDSNQPVRVTGETVPTNFAKSASFSTSEHHIWRAQEDADNPGFPGIYAMLEENGFQLSMANVAQAAKIVNEARLRRNYEALPDEYIIDSLMAGYTVADQHLRQPFVCGQAVLPIQQRLLPATDGASLGEKMTVGGASGKLSFSVPQIACGGVVLIIAEFVPTQLYEDQRDTGLFATTVAQLPDAYQDSNLAVPDVEAVNAGQISVYHSTPDAMFGYWEVNGAWRRHPVRFGGELHRTAGGTNSSMARHMIWPTELQDPDLTTDFYLVSNVSLSVFRNPDVDPFKIAVVGSASVTGLTVFGSAVESEQNYQTVRDQIAPLDPNFGDE